MKKISWGIAICLSAVVIFAGCSKSGAPQASPGGATNAQPEKKKDISVSVYDFGDMPADQGTLEKNKWADWVNQHGPANVKYVPVPRFDSVTKFSTLFAAGNAPDLLIDFDNAYRDQLYRQKQLLPLDDLINKYSTTYKALLQKYPSLKKITTFDDGKIYAFGRVIGLSPAHTLFIRKDWLDKLHLQVPKTTDDFYNVAKAFVEQDPDGNGKKDTFGYNLSFVGVQTTKNMFQDVDWVIQNGKMVKDWDRKQAVIAFLKKLYDNGIVDKDFLTDKNGQKAKQDWLNGKLGIYAAPAGSTDLATYKTFKQNNPNAEIMVMELPKGPYGQFSPLINSPVQATASVNVGAKNTDAVMKYVDFMNSADNIKELRYGQEGQDYKLNAKGCPQIIDQTKFKKEIDWARNYYIQLYSSIQDGACVKLENTLDLSDPVQKQMVDLNNQAIQAYMSPDRPQPDVTYFMYMPSLPKDLQTITSGFSKSFGTGLEWGDIYAKAIVSGNSVSAEQAIASAKDMWAKGGGKQLEDFYAKWYDENKKTAFLTADLYTFK